MKIENPDVLIIGGGAAGAAAAWSLSQTKLKIVCLEQGGFMNPDEYPSTKVGWEAMKYDKFNVSPNVRNLKSDYPINDLESPIADIHFDLHQIPLEENRFDVVFCNHVMEHVEDPIQCMKEIYRVMKPGGWAIMQVPQDMSRKSTYEDPTITSPAEREKHFWQKDHVRLFGRDYPQWLEKAGFKVAIYDTKQKFDSVVIEKYRLMKDELLYIATK